jgi:hypothetical protein
MSYPQPNSEAAVINRLQYFRLLTAAFTDGDIYESKVGCHAIALGPESDFSQVNIAYWDSSQQGNMGRAVVDPQRAFVGQVSAFNDQNQVYTPSNVPGHILFWPNNLFNVEYRPGGFTADARSRLDIVIPVLDVIQYFTPVDSLPVQRIDKHYHYQQLPLPFSIAEGHYFLVIPFYGRKYASINFYNKTDQSIDMAVTAVNYEYKTTSVASELPISAASAVATFGNKQVTVLASANGMFDALVITLENYAALPIGYVNLSITVSDNAL